MKRVRIHSWNDLEALPEGEWVEVEEGLKFKFVRAPRARRGTRAVIPIGRRMARSLKPRAGEILKAEIKGDKLVLERRKTPPARRSRAT
jgi:hypothetical protein